MSSVSASSVVTPSTIDLRELLSICYDLSRHAGESIRRIFDTGQLGTIEKDTTVVHNNNLHTITGPSIDFGSIHDPQTLADLESQRIIIGNLLRIYGKDFQIVGEEGELEGSSGEGTLYRDVERHQFDHILFPEELRSLETKDVVLWIDPLDGTKEFTLGFVQYVTVLIGISYRGRALGGVVHVPFVGGKYIQKHDPLNPSHKSTPHDPSLGPGRTIWGAVGVGVYGSEIVDLKTIPEDRRWITTTRSHFSTALKGLLEAKQPQAIIRCGGAGSKGLLVLTGDADAYLYPQGGTKRWDTAALDAILHAAGGEFTDQYGDPIVYDMNLPHENVTGLLGTLRNHQHYVLPKPNATPTTTTTSSESSTTSKANL